MSDIPKDLQERLEWMRRNSELQEKTEMAKMERGRLQQETKQKGIENTMNYMGGGKYNNKNSKNYGKL